MAKVLEYTLAQPPLDPNDQDTVRRNLYVEETLPGGAAGEHKKQDLALDGTITLDVTEGSSVKAYITNLDEEGNESPAGPPLLFTAVDDIPPNPPGTPLTVVSKRIKHTEKPAPPAGDSGAAPKSTPAT